MNFEAVTVSEAAEFFGVTPKTVYNWLSKEGLPAVGSGHGRKINLRTAHEWDRARYAAENCNVCKSRTESSIEFEPGDTESYDAALARKTRAEADLKELQLAKERDEVVSIPDLVKVLNASVLATQTQILALPSRLATRMLGIEEHGVAVTIIDGEMRQLLSNLATIDAIREASGLPAESENPSA